MKKYRTLVSAAALALMLAACNAEEEVESSAAKSEANTEQVSKDDQSAADEATTHKVS